MACVGLRVALAAVAVAILLIPASAQGQTGGRGCAGKPGDPDRGAVAQYCPKEVRESQDAAGEGSAEEDSTSAVGGKGGGGDAKTDPTRASGDGSPTLPLLDYPASDGLSIIVWFMIAGLALIAARHLYQRRESG